jgi:hypothetical protein
MVSNQAKNVTLGDDEMLLLRGMDGAAVLKFDSSTVNSAEYRWRYAGRSKGAPETGSGSVERKPGEDLIKSLSLGKVSIDWLGHGKEGTVLYYPGSTQVEKRPVAEFETIDLAAEAAKRAP